VSREPDIQRDTTPSLWRHGEFMKLWFGQTISQIGSQVTLLALPLTAILLYDASPFEVGLLSTVEFLPFVLFGLPAGVWVDRLRRKPILVIADLGRFLSVVSIPIAYAFDALHLTQVYVVGFVTGILTVFFDVAYGAYLPSLIERERLVEGNSKLEISRSGAQLAGPGLAGLLVQALKAPVAILADAVSYLGSVVFLLSIRSEEPPIEVPHEGPPRMRHQIAEGVRYVVRHPLLRPLATCTAVLNLFGTVAQAVLLLFAVRTLGLGPGTIGGALTVGNVGFLAGAFVSARIVRRMGVGPAIIVAAVLLGLGTAVVPFATRSAAVPVLIAYGVLGTFGGAIYNINVRSLAQTITPDRMLGRMVATMRFIVWGTIPLGAFVGGVLGGAIGLRPTLVLAAMGELTAFLAILLSPVRRLLVIPEGAEGAVQPEPSIAQPVGLIEPAIDPD
jgi:MFS family permease